MDVINKWISALFLLFLLTAYGNCVAQSKPNAPGNQRVQFYFDKPITLDSLTRYVHSHSKIRFSFNSSKVKGSKIIVLKKGTYTIESLLQQIQQNTSLYYSKYNGYIIFQDNPPKQKTIPPKTKPAPPVKKAPVVLQRKPVSKPILQAPAEETVHKPVAEKDTVIKEDTTLVPVKTDKAVRKPVADTTNEKVITIAVIPASEDRPLVITLGDTSTVKKNQETTPEKKPAPVAVTPPAAAGKKHERTRIARARNSNYGNNAESNWQWQFGPQWKATVPLYDTKYYFTGTNTRNEPYNLLIPGIWVSVANNKHEIMLLVKPAEWYFYNKDPFRADSGIVYKHFDSIPVKSNTRLIKTGAWYGRLQYNYHINEKWMVGAGIGIHLRSGALAYAQSYHRFVDTLVTDSLYSIKNGKDSIKYLSPSFISGKIELAYRLGAVDVGATLLMPLTNPFTSISLNKSRPLNAQLFIRWRINRRDEE